MELINQIINKKYERWDIGKGKNEFLIYDFFHVLGLAVAYFKLVDGRDLLKNEEKNRISVLWRRYKWDSLKEAILQTPRNKYKDNVIWQNEVKKKHYLNSRFYFGELLRMIYKYSWIIEEFKSKFYKSEEEKKGEKVLSYPDIRMKYSMGIKK